MALPYHSLSYEEYLRLGEFVEEGEVGDEFAISCNANEADHLHTIRIGPEGGKLQGRIAIKVHDEHGNFLLVYISPSDARALAANLLGNADDLDGYQPLAFWNPDDSTADDSLRHLLSGEEDEEDES